MKTEEVIKELALVGEIAQLLAELYKVEGRELSPCACMEPYCEDLSCIAFWSLFFRDPEEAKKDIKVAVEARRKRIGNGCHYYGK